MLRLSLQGAVAVARRPPQGDLANHFLPSTTSRSSSANDMARFAHGESEGQAGQRRGVEVLELDLASTEGESSSLFLPAASNPDPRPAQSLSAPAPASALFSRFCPFVKNFASKSLAA